MPKLTKRVVDATMPDPTRKVMVWDAEMKGFGLRVTPSGVKSYVVNYRTPEGRQREFTIGKHGSPWTCEMAREKAREVLHGLTQGVDPLNAKAAARAVVTVKDLADLYIEEGPAERPSKKPRGWKDDRSLFDRHIIPLIGGKPIAGLKPSDIAKMQADIAAGKTAADIKTGFRGRAIVTGGEGSASHAVVCLKAALQFAVRRELIEKNPAAGVQLYKGKKMERFLSVEEAGLIGEAAQALLDDGTINDAWVLAVRLLMLTGCRKGEILGLEWSWIDLTRGLINFPVSKTGAKATPLPEAAIEMLRELPRKPGSPHVFPALRGDSGHMVALQKPWTAVRAKATEIARQRAVKAGADPDAAPDLRTVRLHDLRHSFASFAVEAGASLFLVGKVLGHRQAATTERYAHLRDDPLKALSNSTADRIAAAMKGGKKREPEG